MINIIYNITNMSVISDDVNDNVVKFVDILVRFESNTDDAFFEYNNRVELDNVGDNFVDFDNLTKDEVIIWCENKMFNGPESKDLVIERAEQELDIIRSGLINKLPNTWNTVHS